MITEQATISQLAGVLDVVTTFAQLMIVPTLAAIVWLIRAIRSLEIILTGFNGENGVVSEVKHLHRAKHDQGNAIHALTGRVGLVEHRIGRLEEHR